VADTTPAEVAAVLVHEATHVKQALMRSIGETQPSDEFEAYTMQRITCELFTEYSRRINET
jgi:predicted Zn-dependent protease